MSAHLSILLSWMIFPFLRHSGSGHLDDATAFLSSYLMWNALHCSHAAAECCTACPAPSCIQLWLHATVVSFMTVNESVVVLMLFSSTRGQRSHHSSHHHLHPAAGHFGECTLLPLQKGKDLWPVRKTRPVRPERVCLCSGWQWDTSRLSTACRGHWIFI